MAQYGLCGGQPMERAGLVERFGLGDQTIGHRSFEGRTHLAWLYKDAIEAKSNRSQQPQDGAQDSTSCGPS